VRAHQRLEALWYLRGEESIQAFLAHADQISIVAPQVFYMDSTGVIRGGVDPRVIETARLKGVKVHPLVMNPGFDQPSIHRVLNHPEARAQALRSLAALCRDNKFDGIQFGGKERGRVGVRARGSWEFTQLEAVQRAREQPGGSGDVGRVDQALAVGGDRRKSCRDGRTAGRFDRKPDFTQHGRLLLWPKPSPKRQHRRRSRRGHPPS
jgi:hypothetical protein